MSTIINSMAYRQGKRVSEVELEDISEVIKEKDVFLWMGIYEPDEALLFKIQEEFSLHELAIEDATYAHQRPKLEIYGDSLFVVLKTARLEKDRVEYGETHLFVGKKFFISIRRGSHNGYVTVREKCERSPAKLLLGTGYPLYSVIDYVVEDYRPIIQFFEARFQEMEAAMFRKEFSAANLEKAYELKRELVSLRNIVLPVIDICTDLIRFHNDLVSRELTLYFRDAQDHCQRIIEAIDSMREMMTSAMNVNLALASINQNEVVRGLAGWGALLAVPTVAFSLYGMNFKYMPELEYHYAYPIFLICVLFICGLLYIKLKKQKWL